MFFTEEIWKDIPNYEGLYQASNLGRIKSVAKVTHTEMHGDRVWKERILKPKGCKDYNICGYRVSLWKNGKHKDFLVARLVCTTWHENLIDTKMTVNHKDGNRLNNRVDNLEWLSLSDNIRHGFENNLYKQNKTILTCCESGEVFEFRSQALAGLFLGRNGGYIHNLKKNKRQFARDKDNKKYQFEIIEVNQ